MIDDAGLRNGVALVHRDRRCDGGKNSVLIDLIVTKA